MTDFATILAAKMKPTKKPISKKPISKKLVATKSVIKKKKKPANGAGGVSSKPAKVNVVKKNNSVKWKSSNMKKRVAVVKQRLKDGKKENPNKAAKVIERHAVMQSKSPGKTIPLSKAVVKQMRGSIKSAAKAMSSKAKKPKSKTRINAAKKVLKNNRKALAATFGGSVKQTEAGAAAAFTEARKSTSMPDVKSAAGRFLVGAAKLALLSVIGLGAITAAVSVVGAGVGAITAGAAAIPSGVALLAAGGIWTYIRSSTFAFTLADAVTEENFSVYTPHIDLFIPILEDYIRTGNIEELIGMLADMQDDPDNDEATSNNKPHVVYSEKAAHKLTTIGGIVPDSIIVRRYPGIPIPVKASGIYVCWTVKPDCARKLEDWSRKNKIPHPKPATYLHNTIVFSKTDVCTFDGKLFKGMGLFPVPLSPQRIVKIQKLGPSAIVLKLEFEEAKERFEYLKSLGATSDFPSYISHITVGEDEDGGYVDADFANIELPNFPIEFDYEYCGPLLVDKKQKHAIAASLDLPENDFLPALADTYRNEKVFALTSYIRKNGATMNDKNQKRHNARPFRSVLATVMEEVAGRNKKPQDPSPAEHLKQAIENYRQLIERIKTFDLNGKLDQIDSLSKKLESGEDMEKCADILEDMGDHEGKAGFNNDFYDLMMQVDDGPKEIARAARRVIKEKK